MELVVNDVYKPLFVENTRYYLLRGGRAGGRSHAASQKILFDTKTSKYSRVAIMRYILGDVRSSVWQEFKDRVAENEMPEVTSDQAMIYRYGGNSVEGKGFKKSSSQNVAKLKSLANYNTIVVDEADETSEEDFNNLDSSIRTNKGKNSIMLLFNMPNKDHWLIRRFYNLQESEVEGYYIAVPKYNPQVTDIFATYHHNIANLPDQLIATYESFKETNPDYYYTMIKGYVSEGKKGRVYRDWKVISEAEYEQLPYTRYYGLDFGFTNHPTALVEFRFHNEDVYVKELIYERGLTNQDIAKRMQELNVNGVIIADSAEPKSIEEIAREGFNIYPAAKGPDSIRARIQLLNSYKINYTEASTNIATEAQNYVYALDRNKQPTNAPIDESNHLMDAIGYVAMFCLTRNEVNLTWV